MEHTQIERAFLDSLSSLRSSRPLKFVLGYSGGLDSSVLLRLLHVHQGKDFEVVGVLHVDHNLREESAADAKFAEMQAAKLGFPFYKLDVCPLDLSVTNEVWGREVRYAFYEECRRDLKADYILTAHHLDDEIETFLFKLIFGRSGPNLSLVQGFDQQRKLVRPLIAVSKADLFEYAIQNNVSYVEDQSNLDNQITRNYIRNKILPVMEELNPLVRENLDSFIKTIRGDQEFITELASTYLDSDLKVILKQEDSLAYRILILLARRSLGEFADKLTQRRFKDLLNFLRTEPRGEVLFDLGSGIVAVFDLRAIGSELEFLQAEDLRRRTEAFLLHETFSMELSLGEEGSFNCPLSGGQVKIGFYESSENLDLRIPENSIKEEFLIAGNSTNLSISGRASTDEIMLEGIGRKRLSRYFKEIKVARKKRRSLFYVMEGNDILWIPTLVRSNSQIQTDGRKCVLYYNLENNK